MRLSLELSFSWQLQVISTCYHTQPEMQKASKTSDAVSAIFLGFCTHFWLELVLLFLFFVIFCFSYVFALSFVAAIIFAFCNTAHN